MARHAAKGDEVYVVIVSRGIPEIFPPAVIEKTRDELTRAHALLGVRKVEFLDFPAPKLDVVPGHQLADGLKQAFDRIQPDIVYVPHHGDIHADHKAVYWASLVALRPNRGARAQRVLCYETLSGTEWGAPHPGEAFIPTVFVDISDCLSRKLEAMSCYQSQLQPAPNARSLEAIRALAGFRGATVSAAAAEAFMLIREVQV